MARNRLHLLPAFALVVATSVGGLAEQPQRGATLILELDARGNASVTLFAGADLRSVPELPKCLGEALGCGLQHVTLNGGNKLTARCDNVFHRRGLAVEGEVSVRPVLEALGSQQVGWLTVMMNHPRAASASCRPASLTFRARHSESQCAFWVPASVEPTTRLGVSYGYTSSDALRILAALALVALLAGALILWARRTALGAPRSGREAVWFGYWRFSQLMMLGTLLVWWAMADALRVDDFVSFALDRGGPGSGLENSAALWFAVRFIPPGLLSILAAAASQAVQAQVRGAEWTRREATRQALWSQAAIVLPIVFFFAGIDALTRFNAVSSVLWFAAAFVSRAGSAQRLAKALNYTPHALTVGELHDRVLALAAQAGVKLEQLYLLPAGKGRLANAFARSGNSILLTDVLIQRLSKREVDAVVAHEVAHLKRRHPRTLAAVFLAGTAVLGVLFLPAQRVFPRWAPVAPLGIAAVLPLAYFVKRRQERAADAESVKLTGDPEGLIRALVKLTRLNLLPLQWGRLNEGLLSHPSTLRRAQALARLGGIDSGRLEEILSRPDGESDHYALPPAMATGGKVFSTAFKRARGLRSAWSVIAATTLTPALFASLVQLKHWEGTALWTAYIAGVLATLALVVTLINFLSVSGNGTLSRRLAVKLKREGIDTEAWDGIFVGFAPDPVPRIYESDYSWDMGFLFLGSDHLCYVGEEARFALPREQVTSVRLGAGPPGWWPYPHLYVTWHDAGRSTGGIFSVEPAHVSSLRKLGRETRALDEHLQAWAGRRLALPPLPPPLLSLEPPTFGRVSSKSPAKAVGTRQVIRHLAFVAMLALGVSTLFSLPLGIERMFLDVVVWFYGRPNTTPPLGPGWYVVLTALAVGLFQYLPYWRYREPAASGPPGAE